MTVTGLPRLLVESPGLDEHVRRVGPLPRSGPGLIRAVAEAGLRGRGGASFPTATKLAAVARQRQAQRTVVVNATEGEPASMKDKALLMYAPHLVLDGAALAAGAIGAGEVLVCVDRANAAVVAATRVAINQRHDAGLFRLLETPDRYLAGEESALVHWIDGGDAKPVFVPPRPFERGVDGRPTLLNNAETLAHIALIARFGPAWFREVGTKTDPGSALVSIAGGVAQPGVVEIALGTPLADVLGYAGTSIADASAVLVGGYFGTWLTPAIVQKVRLAPASLAQVDAALGCGVIAVLPQGSCGVAESARVTRWLADQNAGQCGPCVNGLDAIANAMDVLVAGDRDGRAEAAIVRWTAMVTGRGACKHPDGAARFVTSALTVFHDEIEHHRRAGACPPVRPILPAPRPGGWR